MKAQRRLFAIIAAVALSLATVFTTAAAGSPWSMAEPSLPHVNQALPMLASSDPPIAPGRLVVKFRSSVSASEASGVLAQRGLQVTRPVGTSGARLVSVAAGSELDAALQLSALSTVEYAQPDYVVRESASKKPTDPLYDPRQWDMARINMPDAWGITTGASGMRIAVIDSGITFTHPDLASQWTYATSHLPSEHVFLSQPLSTGCVVQTLPMDEDGHGTHVSGIIAAASTLAGAPEVGIAGIAPATRILPLKVLDCNGSGYLSDVASAIDFATANGAAVINMSLGGSVATGCPLYLQSSINLAIAGGVFIAAAAGNNGDATIQYPAGCSGVVGVGSTDSTDTLATSSNRNTAVAISAPGVQVVSTWIDGGYIALSGTSMAAPHVSACAALVKSLNPLLTGPAVRGILQTTAVDLGATGYDTSFGFGRLDCGGAVLATSGALSGIPLASLGGRGLTIGSSSGGVSLTWQGGTGQTGYSVSRLVNGDLTVLTAPVLGPTVTSFVDVAPPSAMACYAVYPQGTSPAAQSDALCAVNGFRSPTAAPQSFTMQLNQTSTATFVWTAPTGTAFDSYVLQTFGGSAQSFATTVTSATVPMDGFACFALGSMKGGLLQGYTDILCGLPGYTNMALPAPTATPTSTTPTATSGATATSTIIAGAVTPTATISSGGATPTGSAVPQGGTATPTGTAMPQGGTATPTATFAASATATGTPSALATSPPMSPTATTTLLSTPATATVAATSVPVHS